MQLFDTYRELYEDFCKIDDFNLEDRVKGVPAQKQFWASRLIDAKINRDKLYKQKKALTLAVKDKLLANSPVSLDKKTLDSLDSSPQLEKINENIKESDYLIEYLELIFKNISFISQDFKNIIDLKRLEEQ